MYDIVGKINKSKREHYVCKCDQCDHIKHIRISKILTDTSCKRCNLILRNKTVLNKHRGHKDLTKSFYGYFKFNAARNNKQFLVSIDYLGDLFEAQNGVCALSGLPITLSVSTDHNGNHTDANASVDRIDSSKGYIKGNVQWVHKYVNVLKNGFSQDEFVYLCHAVARTHANPDLSFLKGNKVRKKEQRLTGEEPTNNPDTSAQHPQTTDDDIVRYPRETLGCEINNSL